MSSMIPESYLIAYERYIREKTDDENSPIIHNRYVNNDKQEGYKEMIAHNANRCVTECFGIDRKNNPSTEEVVECACNVLKLCENLVDWRLVDKAQDILESPVTKERAANAFRRIMCCTYTLEASANAYDEAASVFGYNFNLLAYLFFIKEPDKYLPLAPRKFDEIFDKLAITDCPKLSGHGTWNNYCAFLDCMEDIRQQLQKRYPDEKAVKLLDVHSMLWVIGGKDFEDFYKEQKNFIPSDVRAKETTVCAKARIGQGEYREQMIEYWDGKCAVTGCSLTSILKASHAKPWKDSNHMECRDPFNGLLLTPNLDELFDKGLISFQDDGTIIISSRLDNDTRKILGISDDFKMRQVSQEHLPYLKYHREKIYKKK